MFIQAYLNTAEEILKQYQGEQPFHSFLKKYFSGYKKFGSRDRKYIAHLCYCFFRLGKSLPEVPISKKLLLGIFLCEGKKSILLQKLNKDLNEKVESSLDEKLLMLKDEYGFELKDIFPYRFEFSENIDEHDFSRSFLIQPSVFLRIRPGKKIEVIEKLTKKNISFELVNEYSVAISPATKLEEVLEINREVIIQDNSSQQVLDSSTEYIKEMEIRTAWDCCAASGGKSILLKDHFPHVQLTVSDIRESILNNLEKRFRQAGIKHYSKVLIDLSNSILNIHQEFDLIICDAPCSGSGTWSRTPEQLYFFKEQKIEEYAALQRRIVSNAIKNLKRGGLFLYVTCSVFKKENEEVVKFAENDLGLRRINGVYLKGYNKKADTLFTALFTL